jgi:hypothetical protein
MSVVRRACSMGLGAVTLVGLVSWAQHDYTTADATMLPIDHPAIDYYQAPIDDPGTRLNRRLESGQTRLTYRDGFGYLPDLLKELGINVDSQMLVFSKTSFQAARISPREPRAIYFSDDASVGYVQNSDVLELATLDPRQGYIFYTVENRKGSPPRLDRRDVCVQCHQGPGTSGVPGIMIASVYPDSSGMPFARLGMPVTDHRTRFQDRWGGWYVTGTHGGMMHRGNAVARDRNAPGVLETRDTQNLTSLERKVNTRPYLSPHSDIVALMTIEHQTRISNLMTRVGWQARMAQHDGIDLKALDAPIETLVDYLLFVDEARLLDKVTGTSTFTQTFMQRGPRDRQGRSLRDFDLEQRLFRYRLSYMIYSEAFDGLPALVRERVFRRLYDVLTGADTNPKFNKLPAEERRAIIQILLDTKPNLPDYWRGTDVAAVRSGG